MCLLYIRDSSTNKNGTPVTACRFPDGERERVAICYYAKRARAIKKPPLGEWGFSQLPERMRHRVATMGIVNQAAGSPIRALDPIKSAVSTMLWSR